MSQLPEHQKGRGAQKRIHNRFFELSHELRDDFLNYCEAEGEQADKNQTKYIEVFPKTFVNKVQSPDVGKNTLLKNPGKGTPLYFLAIQIVINPWNASLELHENVLKSC